MSEAEKYRVNKDYLMKELDFMPGAACLTNVVSEASYQSLRDENTRLAQQVKDLEEVLADKRRLTREIDVALNGEHDAAKQASLCDILSQLKALKRNALDGGKGVQGAHNKSGR